MSRPSKSNFLENEMLDHVIGNAAYTAPVTVYVSAHTTPPLDADSGTEVTGNAYARVAVTNNATEWPAAVGGSKSNANIITFPTATPGNWGEIVAFGIYDAATVGNLLYWGWLSDGFEASCTVNSVGDLFTSYAHGFADDERITFFPPTIGGTLPTGIVAGTVYFVAGATADTFTISTTAANANPVVITLSGEAIGMRVLPKTINLDDTARFAANQLVLTED